MIPDLSIFGSQSNTQVFPESMLESRIADEELDLFAELSSGPGEETLNLDVETIALVEKALGRKLESHEWFDYVYAVLSWPAFKSKYSVDLRKELPRVPLVKQFDLMAKLGSQLSALHLNYEKLEEFPLEIQGGQLNELRVTKMRYGGNSINPDKTVIHVTPKVTIRGIPLDAHAFKLGTKSPLDWVVDRYGIAVEKASGIVNDSNAIALRKNERDFPIKLICRLVTMSLETKRIFEQMPNSLDVMEL